MCGALVQRDVPSSSRGLPDTRTAALGRAISSGSAVPHRPLPWERCQCQDFGRKAGRPGVRSLGRPVCGKTPDVDAEKMVSSRCPGSLQNLALTVTMSLLHEGSHGRHALSRPDRVSVLTPHSPVEPVTALVPR